MRENVSANTTHFPNLYFTKVFPSFAAIAHVLLNGRTIATITGTSTASCLFLRNSYDLHAQSRLKRPSGQRHEPDCFKVRRSTTISRLILLANFAISMKTCCNSGSWAKSACAFS